MPELCPTVVVPVENSEPPLLRDPSFLAAVLGVPFWNAAVVGGGASAASSAGGSTPSSTHLFSLSS